MGALQPWHLIVILVIVLIVFGPGKLPEVGKAFGRGVKEFKSATTDEEGQTTTTTTMAAAPPVTPPPSVAPGAAVPVPQTAQTVTCPRCGTVTQATNRFCPSCGNALNTSA